MIARSVLVTPSCSWQVSTVAQLTVLEPADAAAAPEQAPLCVVNTHLFFHPRAPHIRSIHVAVMLAEAHALMEQCAAQQGLNGHQQQQPALLFCGDLNSDLNDGVPGP